MLTPNDVAKCESWFDDHGLPYFVASRPASIRRALAPASVLLWTGVALVTGAAAAVLWRVVSWSWPAAIGLGLFAAVVVVLLRGVEVFRVPVIGRWALAHAWGSRSLLVPLATRALPFLLLFITFLFINTEVWQVASSLSRALLWSSVAVFVVLAVAFLAPSFDKEISRLGAEVEGERLVASCEGTPVASAAREILEEPQLASEVAGIRLRGLERNNLLLMLFVTQAIQVVSLAFIVFGVFVVFGSIAIRPEVIESWVGHPPTYETGGLHLVSNELFSVAVFLSGFAGLYFTVQAVIDQNYRREFFSRVEDDLQRAIGIRKVYVALRAHLAERV
ncbi:hypothetical protein N798_04855 [Knoellia flava TL1]|uniref:Integral membrane protein n=2 Tax=Knoellia flava TaxID=913969 RepID=A0A8H9KNX0_9MICO|nr:hypothetical protein [Knoellia flava]KGN34504.1 hypothetical protein N798_04855 [Knoellia flava TL1]GGB64931.1 hypothetical protein GCM10011314_00190 [Knoellia flava]